MFLEETEEIRGEENLKNGSLTSSASMNILMCVSFHTYINISIG